MHDSKQRSFMSATLYFNYNYSIWNETNIQRVSVFCDFLHSDCTDVDTCLHNTKNMYDSLISYSWKIVLLYNVH